jgi:hypothetical protein
MIQDLITFLLVGVYAWVLYYLTFIIVLTRRRLLSYLRVPSIIYFMLLYVLNLLAIRLLFGYHFLYQLVTSFSMGVVILQYRNLNIIGLTGTSPV